MILRSILLLGVGAAFACVTPALAAGTTAPAKTETAAAQPQAVAALETEKPKAGAPAAKKPTPKAKKLAKAKAKKKKKAVVAEEAKPEKPKGLFAALFGGDIKDEKAKEKVAKKPAPAKPIAKVKVKQTVAPPVEPEPVAIAITGNSGELRSESRGKADLVRQPVRRLGVAVDAAGDAGARLVAREEAGQEASSR